MKEEKELLKTAYLISVLLKVILKKVYNLTDTQYQRVIKAFDRDAEKGVEEYLKGIEDRRY